MVALAVGVASCGSSSPYRGPYISQAQTDEVSAGDSWAQVVALFGKTPNTYFERADTIDYPKAQDEDAYYWPIDGTGHGGVDTGDAGDSDLSNDDSNWPQGTGYKWWRVCLAMNINGQDTRVLSVGLVNAAQVAQDGGDDCPGVAGP